MPVVQSLAADPEQLLERARRMADALAGVLAGVPVEAVRCEARVGGGGGPGVLLPSAGLSLPETLAEPLRSAPLPVVGRVHGGRLLLDLIAVPESLDRRVVDAVREAADRVGAQEGP